MEENKVIMSLEEYTKLIIENNNLKTTLKGLEKRIKDKLCEKFSEQRIYAMSKEEVIDLIVEKDFMKICNNVGAYSYILVITMFIEEVKKIAKKHLESILEKEESDNG